MSRREEDDAGERDVDDLDAAVADAFAKRGEMIPTRVDEVRAAEEDGVEDGVELPASLRAWRGGASEQKRAEPPPGVGASAPRRVRDAEGGSGAASERVVSLDELRRARAERRGLGGSHVASFAVGLAVAAGAAFFLRT
ncbi:MAG TPA: hypothetical protein VL400_25630, partial [Polyangiaceae bacterium]|nr:hypothetical protein [Polyangiaceae bacterium]